MRKTLGLSVLIVQASVAGLALAEGSATTTDETPTVTYKAGEEFFVPAKPGVTEALLGKGFTRDLRDVDDAGKKIVPVYQGKVSSVASSRFASSWTEMSDEVTFGMSASYFGMGGSAKANSTSRFALLTVYQIDKVVKIDTSAEIPATQAELVPVEIWYGWGLNYLFEGQSSGGELSASLKLLAAGGELQAGMARKKITSTFISSGLDRKVQGDIPVVLQLSDVMKYFSPSKKPQPVLIKYVAVKDLKSMLLPGARPKAEAKGKACEGSNCGSNDDDWAEKTIAITKAYVEKNSEKLAAKIQTITHPSGKKPALGETKVERGPKGVVVTMRCDWVGGLIGSSHATTVRWEIGQDKSLGTTITKDQSPTSIGKSNAKQLDDYFNKSVYDELSKELKN